MVHFKIKGYIDRYMDYAKAGEAVFNNASSVIEKGDVILFDMKDLDGVATVFLNTSFGQLIDRYGSEKVKSSFKFTNILRSQADRIKKYFQDYSAING